jgi:hypothetical protein
VGLGALRAPLWDAALRPSLRFLGSLAAAEGLPLRPRAFFLDPGDAPDAAADLA